MAQGIIIVRYGLGNEIKRTVDVPTTVENLITAQVRAVLGIPASVSYFRNGLEITPATFVNGGETVEVQAKACSKAA
jgi:hypothetical protein